MHRCICTVRHGCLPLGAGLLDRMRLDRQVMLVALVRGIVPGAASEKGLEKKSEFGWLVPVSVMQTKLASQQDQQRQVGSARRSTPAARTPAEGANWLWGEACRNQVGKEPLSGFQFSRLSQCQSLVGSAVVDGEESGWRNCHASLDNVGARGPQQVYSGTRGG